MRASTFTIEDLDTPPSQLGRHRDRLTRDISSGSVPPAERLLHPLAVHFSVVLQVGGTRGGERGACVGYAVVGAWVE